MIFFPKLHATDLRHLDAANEDKEHPYVNPAPQAALLAEEDKVAARCRVRTRADMTPEELDEIQRQHDEAADFKRRNALGGEFT